MNSNESYKTIIYINLEPVNVILFSGWHLAIKRVFLIKTRHSGSRYIWSYPKLFIQELLPSSIFHGHSVIHTSPWTGWTTAIEVFEAPQKKNWLARLVGNEGSWIPNIPISKGWGTLIPYFSGQPEKKTPESIPDIHRAYRVPSWPLPTQWLPKFRKISPAKKNEERRYTDCRTFQGLK